MVVCAQEGALDGVEPEEALGAALAAAAKGLVELLRLRHSPRASRCLWH